MHRGNSPRFLPRSMRQPLHALVRLINAPSTAPVIASTAVSCPGGGIGTTFTRFSGGIDPASGSKPVCCTAQL